MADTLQEKVLFDPGYAKHTTILSISSEYMYSNLESYKNFNQRKMNYKMMFPKLVNMTENNVGFCIGCMLWAVYIKSLGDLVIEGNPCLGDTYNKEEAVEEIDFSIEFYNKLKKDAKYYLNLDYTIDNFNIKILESYRDFLTLNWSFVSTKTTNDIVLPSYFKTISQDDAKQIYEKIQEVLETGKLIDLKSVWNLVVEG